LGRRLRNVSRDKAARSRFCTGIWRVLATEVLVTDT